MTGHGDYVSLTDDLKALMAAFKTC
ncbi:hypothetical protein AGR1B_Lc10129 [Agrobacterium fabacearum S56]|nr:hypothetical protein AGR1B_Lc10129 [Agrobacterium fabacearum S56]